MGKSPAKRRTMLRQAVCSLRRLSQVSEAMCLRSLSVSREAAAAVTGSGVMTQRRIRRLPYLFLSYRFHAVGGIRYYRSCRFVRRFVCCPLLCLSSDGIVIFQLPDVAGPENGERQSGCRSVVPFPHMGWKVSLLPFAVSVPSFREVLSLSFRCGASLRILR